MNKAFLVGGTAISGFALALVIGVLLSFSAPQTAHAQTPWQMIINIPQTDILVIANYLGVDRKLKPVAGQNVTIIPPAGQPETEVTMTAVVSGQGILGLASCNGVIATATTVKFKVSGSRTLTASDFTSSGGIGIETSTETKQCIDDLSDKVAKGVGTAPPGTYTLDLSLNLASTGAQLATVTHTIQIVSASAAEVNLNLISPGNGEQLTQSNPSFQFDAQKEGKLYVFEHNTLSQSSEDAIRDLNSPFKCLEVAYNTRGVSLIPYSYPGNAVRPLVVNKKYTWFIRAIVSTGGGQTETRRSPLYTFTMTSSDPDFVTLLNALNNATDPIGSTFTNAISSGYRLNYSNQNQVLQKIGDTPESKITVNDVLSILNRLAGVTTGVTASITNQ